MILYLFLSCQKLIHKNYERIKNMMKQLNYDRYAIITGGHKESWFDNNEKKLKLNCNDAYEGLPEKMIKAYKFIYENEEFSDITHICKLDEDMLLKKLLNKKDLSNYCGKVCFAEQGNRSWHLGKCTPGSKFNKLPYLGSYVPWCLGGWGYVLSRKSMGVLKDDKNYNNEIYEDLYVATVLRRNKIFPTQLKNLEMFFRSPEHN